MFIISSIYENVCLLLLFLEILVFLSCWGFGINIMLFFFIVVCLGSDFD